MRNTLATLLVLCALAVSAEMKLEVIDSDARHRYIKRAQVWKPTDVSKVNIWTGPANEIAVPPGTEITCKYIEWKKEPSGVTPKFDCQLRNGQKVRIKFGKDVAEVFAEAAASRLAWALGFYADEVYSVKVRCLQCPANPFKPQKGERRQTRLFEFATMERRFPGVMIEEKEDQGWAWKELEEIDPKEGGAPFEQVDGLRLFAVLIQHGDQKPEQQRIGCYNQDLVDDNRDGIATCNRPVMITQDLGATFGRANQFTSPSQAKMNFSLWSENPVFNEQMEKEEFDKHGRKVCIGDLTNSGAAGQEGLQNPVISEEGRKFLAGLLSQLSEKQIRDLFRAARADQRDDWIEKDGQKRRVTIEDWTQAFLKKRQVIIERSCGESTEKPKEEIKKSEGDGGRATP